MHTITIVYDIMITLYHGSESIIERPVLGKGKRNNDYGIGFYCTVDLNMSKEWACTGSYTGYSNKYEFDDSGMNILHLNESPFGILHWMTVLLENRSFDVTGDVARTAKEYLIENYHIDKDAYDMIIGWRADDSYFTFAQDFIDGRITVNTLSKAMKLGNLGLQHVLISERSFENIAFIGYERAERGVFYERRVKRDDDARREYKKARSSGYKPGDILITHLIDGTVGKDDVRLQ